MSVSAMKKKKVLAVPQRSPEELQKQIRERAYHLFEDRQEHGHDLDDWLRAEAEVLDESSK